MSESSSNAREISLAKGFGVVVKVNDARVEVHADRRIVVYANEGIDVYTNGAVQVHPAAQNDGKPGAITAPQPGDRMPDGTIFAGISPDTHKAMYAAPKDAPLTYTFNQAQKYASKLDAHGHQDWRVPSKDELNVLFNNRVAIGGFDVGGSSHSAGLYWSSSQFINNSAWVQRFSAGNQDDYVSKGFDSSLRCVRG